MAEYIERDYLAGELERIYEWHYEGCNHKAIHDVFRAVLRRVRSAPAADVVPVVRGRWKRMKAYHTEYVCSECGDIWPDFRSDYCPNCGARMEEV